MKTIKYSRQREAIVNFLKTRKDHPTAEVIYNNIKITYPNISLGTVYRNLNLLSETGEILKISLEDDSAHFDGFTHPHLHFFCKNCKCVTDIEPTNEDMQAFMNITSKYFSGHIESHISVFYGICKECIDECVIRC